MQLDYVGIAYDLHVDNEMVKSIINDFDLFIINDNTFSSLSIKKRLEAREEKSEKNSNAANIRWAKHRENTNAMQTQCERIENECKRNAIIEYNIIEYNNKDIIKEEEEKKPKKPTIEERKIVFKEKLKSFLDTYSRDMLNDFFLYWTEHNTDGKKMRFEMEKVFDVKRRLKTWYKNSLKNNKFTPQSTTPLILDTADIDKARRLEQEYMQSLKKHKSAI